MTFKDLDWKPLYDGVQGLLFFPNGYGISVVRHKFSYGSDRGLYEIAVLKGTKDDFQLCYTTRITNDVLGYQSEDDVTQVMRRIQRLKSIV